MYVRSQSDIVEIIVTAEMLKKAQDKARKMGCLNKHSMMKGTRNIEGALGELAVLELFPSAMPTDTHDHDCRLGTITIDVKTKRLARKPSVNYDCTVYGYNPNQNCDIYLFAGVSGDHSTVWLSGFLKKEEFYKKAEFCPAGSQRPLGNGRMLTYEKDNYVVQINQLNKIELLIKHSQK